MTPVGHVNHSAVQGSGFHNSSPLESRSSPATAFWPLGPGGGDMGTPAAPQAPPMGQSQAGDTSALHSQSKGGRQQQASGGGSLPQPGVMHAEHLEMGEGPPVSALDPYHQDETGVPLVLSGGSSGVSSPLRESGHLEGLLEVNNRVEAAMGRARAQLHVSLYCAYQWQIKLSAKNCNPDNAQGARPPMTPM